MRTNFGRPISEPLGRPIDDRERAPGARVGGRRPGGNGGGLLPRTFAVDMLVLGVILVLMLVASALT